MIVSSRESIIKIERKDNKKKSTKFLEKKKLADQIY